MPLCFRFVVLSEQMHCKDICLPPELSWDIEYSLMVDGIASTRILCGSACEKYRVNRVKMDLGLTVTITNEFPCRAAFTSLH